MKMLYENLINMRKCRCCLAEDCYRDINTEYCSAGQTETYSKMLLETFGVQMSKFEDYEGLICLECVTKLQEANAFKQQVLQAENTFVQQLMRLKEIDSSARIENESKQDISCDLRQNDVLQLDNEIKVDCFSDNDGNDEYLEQEERTIEIKQENALEDPNFENETKTIQNFSSGAKCKKNLISKKTVNGNNIPNISKISTKTKKPANPTESSKNQRENTIKLLLNSNVCLFTSFKTKYGCYFCKERFLDFKHLREHANMHSNDEYIVSSVNHLRGLSCKNVDISNLACKLCNQPCQDLSELQTHLTASHDIEFNGVAHFLTPYKLENGLQCVVCRETFNTFLRLSIHMNSHSTNNVCEICGVSYINRLSLRVHVHSLHKEKQCKLCPATFLTNSTKARHMRRVHGVGDYKRYCLLCEKTFRYTYMLVEHNIKEHGAKRRISECAECGKAFPSEANLKVHMRAVHMKERNFPCGACDMRFFTSCDRRRHERTHRDERAFSCAHCHAHFKTKDSWRRHLKRQHTDQATHT